MQRKDAGWKTILKIKPNREKIEKFEQLNREFLLEQAKVRKQLVQQGKLTEAVLNILKIKDSVSLDYLKQHLDVPIERLRSIVVDLEKTQLVTTEAVEQPFDG